MNYEQHYLGSLFEPKSIGIIGASETPGSVGATLMRNIVDGGFQGKLFVVNPSHETVFGHKAHASVDSIPHRLDLAVICTEANAVPSIVEACGRAGTRNAIIISGGFIEMGQRGANLLRSTFDSARRYKLRLLGPNCLGLMRPWSGINATFANSNANPGSIGLISQSGALCTAILDWALPNGVGFSNVVSLGSETDIDFGEVLEYMVADPRTESIFLYIEGIKNARRFMSALRAALDEFAGIRQTFATIARAYAEGSPSIVTPLNRYLGHEEAAAVANAYRFPPVGHRSWGGPAFAYGLGPVGPGQAQRELNASILVACMIETPEAVANADSIAAVPGVDVLMFGTSDLTATLGIPGQIAHPGVRAAYATVGVACTRHGKVMGMGGVYDEATARDHISLGARFLLSGSDHLFLMNGASARAKFLRGLSPA